MKNRGRGERSRSRITFGIRLLFSFLCTVPAVCTYCTCTYPVTLVTSSCGTSPTRRSDIVLNVHDMRDVPGARGFSRFSILDSRRAIASRLIFTRRTAKEHMNETTSNSRILHSILYFVD